MHGSADLTASPGAESVLADLPAGAAELPTRLPTRFTRLGLIHVEGPACELLALESLNSRFGRRAIRHFDKAKAAGLPRVPVRNNIDRVHRPILLKELAEVIICRTKRKVPDKDIHAKILDN
jgi:hypothetical protein